ncbi:CaiB/BaiF CoA transferase family protein [Verticiella sediminum]|uniref:CaiB/BaiF CoA transferase family protein n=1 Tax=Verticiella sediminum TaxID=1247510 RepID=UPI001478DB78|nr:CoA transferase [Verticiella sediminum]
MTPPALFAGLSVLELGVLPAGAYTARLLAELGAHVVKFEPPAGDPARHASPCIAGGEPGLASAWFAWLNAGKHSARLGDAGATLLDRLVSADVVIDSLTASERTRLGIDLEGLRRERPGLIVADLSWFGRSGPYAGFRGTDAVCRALAGLTSLTGPAAGPPLGLPDYQAAVSAGLAAFVAVAASLYGRLRGVAGMQWETSVFEASCVLAEMQATEAHGKGARPARLGLNRYTPTFPMGVYACAQGWLGVTVITPAQWRDFCALLGLPELAADPALATGVDRLAQADRIDTLIGPRLRERTAAEWFEQGLARRLPFVEMPDMGQVLASPRFAARGALATYELGARTLHGPGVPWRIRGLAAGGRVPRLGEAAAPAPTGAWPGALARAPRADAAASPAQPLAGLRVLDLSMGWAGPLCTRQLADLGASVVKVESCGYADWWRGTSINPDDYAARLYEKQPRFNMMNRNKEGITLDLTHPEGVALVKALARDADLVVENYSNGVLAKLGLDYPQLRAIKPDLVMLSMSAYGAGGAWAECRAYGSTLEQGAGLPGLNGVPGQPPVMNHIAYGDAVGGLNAACAALAALMWRDLTGEGQHLDISQIECMLPYAAPWLLAHSAAGATPERVGNRHPDHAPHGIYRCAGADAWVLVSVADDAAWAALCQALGRDDLRRDATLAHAAGRRAAHDRLDRIIAAWTARHAADSAMHLLQAAGVPAGVIRAPHDLFDDAHLAARGHWREMMRPHVGSHPLPAAPFRPQGRALPMRGPAPTLGEHNDRVLGRLGLDAEAIAQLRAAGVIGEQAYPPAKFIRPTSGVPT